MADILYPTRGGDPTYRNQDLAAALARERGGDLLLLYVGNVHFLDYTSGPVLGVEVLQKELDEMAEFLLAIAKERVEKTGVVAHTLIRHGIFRHALKEVIQEHDISAVVLGRPAHDRALTTLEFISKLAQSLSENFEIEFFVVHEGKIVEHFRPSADNQEGDE